MFNPFRTKKVVVQGVYFGSHPQYPQPLKMVWLKATDSGVEVWRNKTLGTFSWADVTGFDFKNEPLNTAFKLRLGTKTGNVDIEMKPAVYKGDVSDTQRKIDHRRHKLNKFKHYVAQRVSS